MAGPVFAGLNNGNGALEHRDHSKSSHLHKEMDVSWQLQYLLEQNPSRRVDILHNMRKTLRKHGGNLPIFNKYAVFEAFYHILGDTRWKVNCECCLLIAEIIPLTGEDLDSCMLIILPRVIPNLGHDHVDVRRATLKVLHVYSKYTNNLQRFLRVFVQYGLESNELATRKGCILSIPLLFTEEFANENLYILVESLCELMVNADNTTFYPIFLALQKLHALVGQEVFKVYLKQVNPDAATLYMRVLRNSTSYDDGLVEFNNKLSEDIDDRRINSILQSTSIFKPHILEFGLFESAAIDRIKQGEWRDRIEGVGYLKTVIKESFDLTPLFPYMDEFLMFLSRILEDTNFKVTVLALDVIEVLIEKLKSRTKHYIRPFVTLLFKHLGDSRIVVREHNVRVLHKFMHEVPPQLVLDILLESRHHRNPRLREEIINRVTAAVLTFPSSDFDFAAICQAVAPLLIDTRRHVRLATLECFAVLAQAMGPSKLSPLVSAVDAVELNSDCDGLMTAVQSRLARRVLPRCTVDGMVLYALNLPTLSNGLSWTGSSMGADVDWVMLASSTSSSSSSNSGTPPSRPLPDILPLGTGFTPPSTSGSDSNNTVASYSETVDQGELQKEISMGDLMSDWQPTRTSSAGYEQDGADSTKVEYDDEDKQTVSGSGESDPNNSSHPESPFSCDLESVTSKDTNGTSSVMGTVLLPNRVRISSASAGITRSTPPKAPNRVMSVGEAMDTAASWSNVDANNDQSPIPLKPTLARTQSGRRRLRASSEPSVAVLGSSGQGEGKDSNGGKSAEKSIINNNPVLSSLEELRLKEKNGELFPNLSAPAHSYSPPRSFSADLASHISARSAQRKKVFPESSVPFPDRPILVRSPSFSRMRQNQELQIKAHSLDSIAGIRSKTADSNVEHENSDSKSDEAPSTSGSDFSSDQDLNKSIFRMTRENIIQRQHELMKEAEERTEKEYEQLQQQSTLDEESSVGSVDRQIKEEPDEEDEEEEKKESRKSNAITEEEGDDSEEKESKDEKGPLTSVVQEKTVTYKDEPKTVEGVNAANMANIPAVPPATATTTTTTTTSTAKTVRSSGKTPILRRRQRITPATTRTSHSVPPSTRLHTTTLTLANLENLSNSSPEDAVKSIMASLGSDNWSTKTAAMRTVRQIVNNNPMILQGTLHQLILALVAEVKNLRSSVARSAISTLGVMFANLKRSMEVELDMVVQTLLQKSGENVSFIREDIEKTLNSMVDAVSPVKAAMALLNGGSRHRNGLVRRTAANFISLVVDRMGPIRCLEGPKELREQLLPAAAQFVMDGSPITRYYGRRIFQLLMVHPNFDHLLRRYVQPATLRNISTIMDTIRKKGVGERPMEGTAGKLGLKPDFSSINKTM